MRLAILALTLTAFACNGAVTPSECKNYTALAAMLALQIAEKADPASEADAALRARWTEVGKLAAQAGCEHLDEATP